jgi:hypothetical protein
MMYEACEITFQPKMSYTDGKTLFEVRPNLEGISVASCFHAYEKHFCDFFRVSAFTVKALSVSVESDDALPV